MRARRTLTTVPEYLSFISVVLRIMTQTIVAGSVAGLPESTIRPASMDCSSQSARTAPMLWSEKCSVVVCGLVRVAFAHLPRHVFESPVPTASLHQCAESPARYARPPRSQPPKHSLEYASQGIENCDFSDVYDFIEFAQFRTTHPEDVPLRNMFRALDPVKSLCPLKG